ncbi:MAG: sigma-54-dependent Fis family transcriptional regulator [Candidatus Saganbacteria bacterium]|nr:sigma-54-dependent Fis family transcriptional regulator [Candidatus Saganbacteria bacterium]
MPRILVVDDELSIRESFSLMLSDKYDLFKAASGEAALKMIADQKLDLAYLDIRMPGLNGLETLKRLKEIDPELEIIMVTAVNDVSKASEAIKLGARDYVVKPFDVDHIQKLTDQILRKKAILSESIGAQKKAIEQPPELIGQSEKMSALLKKIGQIQNDVPVFIIGEMGTETEIVAQIIHSNSNRAAFPFTTAYLSKGMSSAKIQTLFFGWGKGVSTINLSAKSGLFEETKRGTLFVGNIDYLPEEVFKTIAKGEFSRTGSQVKIAIESRLTGGCETLPSTNLNNKVVLEIPALRQRSADIPLLINHFLKKEAERYQRDLKISSEAFLALTNYSWPGNTQELACLIERFFLCFRGKEIELKDLPFSVLLSSSNASGANFSDAFEKEYIQRVFRQCGKNKERAASFLGINPNLLEAKLSR